MKKTKDTNKGITLIALVITIIVMLILVAVTITMALKGGLFDYASSAGRKTNTATADEQEYANLQPDMTVNQLIDKYTGWTDSSSQGGTEKPEQGGTGLQPQVGDYISNYPVGYTNLTSLDEKYTGWRILSTEGSNVKLISAGIPLKYKGGKLPIMPVYDITFGTPTTITKLTSGFLDVVVNTEPEDGYFFNECGFTIRNWGNKFT